MRRRPLHVRWWLEMYGSRAGCGVATGLVLAAIAGPPLHWFAIASGVLPVFLLPGPFAHVGDRGRWWPFV